MLDITIWKDGGFIEIAGTIDPGIVLTPSFAGYSLFLIKKFIITSIAIFKNW